ncbi:hypothetical protein ACHAXH_000770 [Discostella pseudostelligera]
MTNNRTIPLIAATAAAALYMTHQARQRTIVNNFVSKVVIPTMRVSYSRRYHAHRRRSRRRKTWSEFVDELSERQFRRYFRMSRELFMRMCYEIEDLVGQTNFKSEEYLRHIVEYDDGNRSINIVHARDQSTGGFITGEVKLVITLQVLGGGSYMDIALLFGISFNHAHKILGYVIQNWLTHPFFYPIDGIKYCSDEQRMREVSDHFFNASQGVMSGCIGALDG